MGPANASIFAVPAAQSATDRRFFKSKGEVAGLSVVLPSGVTGTIAELVAEVAHTLHLRRLQPHDVLAVYLLMLNTVSLGSLVPTTPGTAGAS